MGICNSRQQTEADLSLINYDEEKRHLYVICVVFNPARSRTTIKLYNHFRAHMEKAGAKLITVEVAYENSPFSITIPNYEPYNMQLRTKTPIFQKEQIINKVVSRLPLDAKYVIYCDYEVEFLNPNWLKETIKSLNMVKAVQLFEEVTILGPVNEELRKEKSFALLNFGREDDNKPEKLEKKQFETSTLASGIAWGFRLDAWKELGGLFSYSPLGNNDRIMAYCLGQRYEEYIPAEMSDKFKDAAKAWQKRAAEAFQSGIICIPGPIKLYWTNAKREKKVYEKWEILVNNNFDPKKDLIIDDNGLYTLDPLKPKLVSDLKEYFTSVGGEMIE